MVRLADLATPVVRPPGCRVMLDLRLLQEPDRAPITAGYLRSLLGAFAAEPLPDEDLVAILRARRPDPTQDLTAPGLPVVGRRWLPPTARPLRSLGLPLDGLLLRAAQIRVGSGGPGSAGVVFHTAGGAIPARSPMPVVVTLLDLAPWELPDMYARTLAARLGHRARVGGLRRAARVIVASRSTADAAVDLLGVDRDRIHIVPLAADDAFRPGPPGGSLVTDVRRAHGIPERYLVVGGRYDARSDLQTLLVALRALRARGTASADPPCLVLVGAAGHDPAGPSRVTRLVERHGVLDLVRMTPPLPVEARAALAAAAVGHVQPALSDATGISAQEAIAAGVPVIASRTGALPEVVGAAGIIVEPREPARLAAALETLWSGGPVAQQVTRAAWSRATEQRRRWTDVARDTRAAYAAAVQTTVTADVDPADDALG